MNKGLMLVAFAVLLLGSAFAMVNATASGDVQGKYIEAVAGTNVTTEGGNVTNVTIDANSSTEKWAGFYGNVSGNLLLQKGTLGRALYAWTWDAAENGGEVCVSINSLFPWANIGTPAAGDIDTAWSFAGGADNVTNTLIDSCALDILPNGSVTGIGQQTYDASGVANWETCAVTDSDAGTAKTDFAFCVNMSTGVTAAPGPLSNFQVIAPTNEAALTYEDYFFYVELV